MIFAILMVLLAISALMDRNLSRAGRLTFATWFLGLAVISLVSRS